MSADTKNLENSDSPLVAGKLPTTEEMKEWLYPVEDPEIHMSLVGLGLIYSCAIKPVEGSAEKNLPQFDVEITMTLTSPACPMAGEMVGGVRNRVLEYPGAREVDVQIVMEPKWDPKTMASDEVKEALNIW